MAVAAFESANPLVQRAYVSWPNLEPFLFVPQSEGDYERLVSVLDAVTDTVGENESHPLASLMDVMGVLVERYEDENVPELVS